MPGTIRRELLAYGEHQHPAATVTLYGPESFITGWYYPQQDSLHLLGTPGPRGGARTACGRRVNPRWTSREHRLPDTGRSYYWRYTCTECKEALGIG